MLPDVETDAVFVAELTKQQMSGPHHSRSTKDGRWSFIFFFNLIGFMILALWGGRGEGDKPGGTRDWSGYQTNSILLIMNNFSTKAWMRVACKTDNKHCLKIQILINIEICFSESVKLCGNAMYHHAPVRKVMPVKQVCQVGTGPQVQVLPRLRPHHLHREVIIGGHQSIRTSSSRVAFWSRRKRAGADRSAVLSIRRDCSCSSGFNLWQNVQ